MKIACIFVDAGQHKSISLANERPPRLINIINFKLYDQWVIAVWPIDIHLCNLYFLKLKS